MRDSDEMMALGIILILFGGIMLVSPIADNFFLLFVKIDPTKLAFLSIMSIIAGIAIFIISAKSK